MKLHALVTFAVASGTVLAVSGCVDHASWLPDSSGFVYTEATVDADDVTGFRLMHYDIKKKAGRVLKAQLPRNPSSPAVSPEGKRIALFARDDSVGLIFLYDLEGKELQRSSIMPWGDNPPLWLVPVWAPKGDRIGLLWLRKQGDSAVWSWDIYDPAKDQLVKCPQVMLLGQLGLLLDPRGRGIVSMVKGGETPEGLALVDWEGRVHGIAADFPLISFETCWEHTWQKDSVVFSGEKKRIEIDVAKKTARLLADPNLEAPFDTERVGSQWVFSGGNRLLGLRKGGGVEFQKASQRAGQALVDGRGALAISLAPDRKSALIETGPEGEKHEGRITVVHEDGTVVATVPVRRPRFEK